MTALKLEPTQGQKALNPFIGELSRFPYFAVHIDKVPRILGSQDRLHWSGGGNLDSLETLMQDNEYSLYDGYGWVALPHTCIICIDLDGCIDAEGNLSDTAVKVLEAFPGTYAEYSPSGKGLHVWLKLNRPWEFGNKHKKTSHGFEIKSNMFVTITGNQVPGSGDCLETYPHETLETWFEDFTGEKLNLKAAPLDSNDREKPNKITVEELRGFLCDPDPKKAGIEANENAGILEDCFLGTDPSATAYNFLNRAARFCPYDDVLWELIRPTGLYQRRKHNDAWWDREIAKAITKRTSYYGTERDNVTNVRVASEDRKSRFETGHRSKLDDCTPRGNVTMFAEIEPKPIDWLWDGWLARGMVSIIAGHPGEGKSTIASALASEVSRGGVWPDGSPAPTLQTLFMLGEESPEYMVRPRFDCFNADVSQIGLFKSVTDSEGRESFPDLAQHIEELEGAVIEGGYKLLVIDPVSSFLPRSNRNDEGAIRDLLTPVIQMAERTNCAVLAVMHLGKAQANVKRSALQQLLGSTGFGALARTVMMVSPMPSDPSHKALGIVKSNLGQFPPTLEFSRGQDAPITWHGTSSHQIAALIEGTTETPRGEAGAWLRTLLADGPKSSGDVKEAAKAAGISEKTFERARKEIGVITKKEGLRWQMQLPASAV